MGHLLLFHHNQHRRNCPFGHAGNAFHLAERLRRNFGELGFQFIGEAGNGVVVEVQRDFLFS